MKNPAWKVSRIILILDAALFMGFGLLYVLFPHQMAASVGIHLATVGALIDLQGLYGGLELGLGLYLGFCASNYERHRMGLMAGSFALSGIAVVRLLAILRTGLPESSVLLLVGLDFFGALLNIFFYKLTR